MKKKLIVFCMAVGLSLTLAAPSFAVPTLDLNADSLATGTYTSGSPLIISTAFGSVSFVGEINSTPGGDDEFIAAGASGNTFDVPSTPNDAELSWSNFEVRSAEFIYGGNAGNITIEARDINGNVLDSFSQSDTGFQQPAGPITLYAGYTGAVENSIRSLWWTDTSSTNEMAALDNITLSIIPAPGAILLGSIGVGFVGWLRRRRTL
ncbi:MAG: hypothetical protein FVQ84_03475 [Planctomycetes bacterium]|nr:hypothetical protein [Planctomycetota bacterium]